MPELKYQPHEPPELEPGEPFFYMRAQDVLAPLAVMNYAALLRGTAAGAEAGGEADGAGRPGSRALANDLREQARQCEAIAARMVAWQAVHHVKLPD